MSDDDVAGEYTECPRCRMPQLVVWVTPDGVDRVCTHCGLGWTELDAGSQDAAASDGEIALCWLADLRAGDEILDHGGTPYPRPVVVDASLAPLEDGSPVWGVRVHNPNPASSVEWVLYPDQHHGILFKVRRRKPGTDAG